MAHPLFVYGSLLSDEVQSSLLVRLPPAVIASVFGYSTVHLRGEAYPTLVPSEESVVFGRVLYGLTYHDLVLIDDFECDESYLAEMTVSVLGNDDTDLVCHTYMLRPELVATHQSDIAWDLLTFLRDSEALKSAVYRGKSIRASHSH
jgi:gamma-glutamylcyclotransferase (GGCT)/AIG2-like uncharacterized protein YtfP